MKSKRELTIASDSQLYRDTNIPLPQSTNSYDSRDHPSENAPQRNSSSLEVRPCHLDVQLRMFVSLLCCLLSIVPMPPRVLLSWQRQQLMQHAGSSWELFVSGQESVSFFYHDEPNDAWKLLHMSGATAEKKYSAQATNRLPSTTSNSNSTHLRLLYILFYFDVLQYGSYCLDI